MIRLSYEIMSATLPDLQIKTVLSFLQAHSITLLEFLTSVLQSTDCDARRSADVILQNPQVILDIIGSHPLSQSAAQRSRTFAELDYVYLRYSKGLPVRPCLLAFKHFARVTVT